MPGRGSPLYLVEKKLGKGGFGQVFVGKRQIATSGKEGAQAQLVRHTEQWLSSKFARRDSCRH